MKRFKIIIFGLCLLTCNVIPLANVYGQDTSDLPQLGKASIEEVIVAMTLEEKAALVVGTGLKMGEKENNMGFQIPNQPIPGSLADQTKVHVSGAVGRTLEIPRLGVTTIEMVDGPAGPSFGSRTTAYPIATNLSSTWDVDLVYEVGKCMGNEVSEYGLDLLLAPGMNIHRNPLGGRNFEYYSEDPLLSGKMGAAVVNGIQSQGVGTSVKHFVANNQETNRIAVDALISERALREIYLKGFKIAVKESDPWTLMASYNSVNGATATGNYDLLTTIARDDWGYEGIIMSDWDTGKDPVEQMKAGLSLIMPGPYQDTVIIQAVKSGKLSEEVLDKNIAWILKNTMRSPKFKGYEYSGKPDLENNAEIARKAGAEGMVLLKNENKALPIKDKNQKIALFGNGSYVTNVGGSGSGFVMHAGPTVNIIDGLISGGQSIEETSKQVYTDYIKENTPKQNMMRAIRGYIKRAVEMPVNEDLAKEISEKADIAVITIRRNSGETADRKIEDDINLTDTERSNIENITNAFHALGKKVVVVLNIGGVIETASWKSIPDAILIAWQPGQEAGDAVADVITGNINPSGKLPMSFPVKYEDVSSAKNFPGTPAEKPEQVIYEEGIYVGYRYFNSFNVETSYPFGYGLSYTGFNYSNLKLSSKTFKNQIEASIQITNTGDVAGKEVVQLYITAPEKKLDKPSEELKGFAKTKLLQPGESQTISFKIDAEKLASFYSNKSSWIADEGEYTVKIGASCEEIKLSQKFNLKDDILIEKVSKALAPKETFNELKK
ncbi:glycoside hydrolase family 3 C-terminal domain-containing protein [Draconibacterium sp. IB214405]|uniref:beta-glucosidase n=1 Tax=Draconibacterium sp. IB214405 TaxID=3097352 RepID=UPI002A179D49|nr:glycoside hydrolase family 3 C-terminal domain-containing protein [Draconibacterium sp. IB214405]MDX8341159.1 glycoside hydrolase family 3 C-terminal domain-containing protein [Draconibacterium sp. IB214405]